MGWASGSSSIVTGVAGNGVNIYAATLGGGLQYSSNGGSTWSRKLQSTSSNGYVNGVAVNGGTVYVATSKQLITSTSACLSSYLGIRFVGGVNGVWAYGTTIYAAISGGLNTPNTTTTGGLSISTNGGTSFTNKTTTNGLGSNALNGVYVVGSTVYAATGGGLSKATVTNGTGWSPGRRTCNPTYTCNPTAAPGVPPRTPTPPTPSTVTASSALSRRRWALEAVK
jgi:hypothetical protein